MVQMSYNTGHVSRVLTKVRQASLQLPEVTERLSHGGPAFFVREKKSFVMFLDDHHGDGRLAIWCAAPEGVQAELIESEPTRFFRPPYVGHRGWLGVLLLDPDMAETDRAEIDQAELDAIVLEAYRCVAPKSLLAQLER